MNDFKSASETLDTDDAVESENVVDFRQLSKQKKQLPWFIARVLNVRRNQQGCDPDFHDGYEQ